MHSPKGPGDNELRLLTGATMLEGLFRPMHLVMVLVIALLVFGPKRLPEPGKSLGDGIRSLKRAISGHSDPPSKSNDNEQQHHNGDAHV